MTGILVTPYVTGEGKGMEVDEKKSHVRKRRDPSEMESKNEKVKRNRRTNRKVMQGGKREVTERKDVQW